VPQTPSLCGGAAVAMVFRFWGDRHAGIEPFEPLVDRRAGGIETDRLVDAVRRLGWQAASFEGSPELLRGELAAGHPLVLLFADRPTRYHYVVAIGADDTGVWIHDPEWGPSRRVANDALERAWAASNFWSLLIMPTAGRGHSEALGAPTQLAEPAPTHDECSRLIEQAVVEIHDRGLETADVVLGRVRAACPTAAEPIAELAGVRFAQGRAREAASLASQALARDGTNAYAWDVLGSSRFVLDDRYGALAAWNEVGGPRIDSVDISGLRRTRYALVAQALALEPNTLLTADRLRLAERRLDQLPDRSSARIDYRPGEDGFARVDVAVAERPSPLDSPVALVPLALDAAVNREIAINVPGAAGQGALWTGSWRFWQNRPRAALELAAPRVGRIGGVWRVEASWEAQTYRLSPASPVREEQLHGALAVANWLAPDWRYEVAAGADSWDRSRRSASLAGTLERRLAGDRVSMSASAAHWFPLSGGAAIDRGDLSASFRSSPNARGLVTRLDAGIDAVSAGAPLALWSGAGAGQARAPLLRAHPLLDDGIVDGAVFGRELAYGNAELDRWFDRPRLARVGVAGFVDSARAAGGTATPAPLQLDAGLGLRLRIPGSASTLRVDYARGLRDGANALTIAWAR